MPIAGRGFLRVVGGTQQPSWDDVDYTRMDLVRDVTRKYPDLSMNEKSVLKALVERIDAAGRCWPSYKSHSERHGKQHFSRKKDAEITQGKRIYIQFEKGPVEKILHVSGCNPED